VVALLVLLSWTTRSANAAAAPTTKQLQRQRQQAFTKYAERVGLALDLLINGPVDVQEEQDGSNPAERVEDRDGQPLPPSGAGGYTMPPLRSSSGSLSILAQCMQYPHTVLRAAVQAATEKAAAARTLASVLWNSELSDAEETRLARVRAAAGRADVAGDAWAVPDSHLSSSRGALRQHRRTRLATTKKASAGARAVSTLADTASPFSRYITCSKGYVALPSDTAMHCAAAGATTIGKYMTIPAEDRKTCSIAPPNFSTLQQQCICPVDAVLIKDSKHSYKCVTRPVEVKVLLEDSFLCRSAADAALGLPSTMASEYCVTTTRNATLNMAVQWAYAYLSIDQLRAAVDTSAEFVTPRETPQNSSALQWVVMGSTPPDGIITAINGSPYAKGNYSELAASTDLFTFLSPPTPAAEAAAAAAGVEPFYITSNSTLYRAYAFSAIFCFSAPRKTKEHLVESALDSATAMSAYFGNLNGTTAHTLRLDLSKVSDDFVEGNQMYVETGVRGGSTVYTYRVARLHISFSDLAVPSVKTHRYKKQFNPLYTLLIVAIGVAVVGAGLAVLWYHLMQKEDYDDKTVSDAQRRKGKNKAAAS
jgi:hypothetical protein